MQTEGESDKAMILETITVGLKGEMGGARLKDGSCDGALACSTR